MTLANYIRLLENAIAEYGDLELGFGLGDPHSCRGFYEHLAFEPKFNVKLSVMLREAQECLGTVFQGYKGGDYRAHHETKCYVDRWGRWSEIPLSKKVVRLMLLTSDRTR